MKKPTPEQRIRELREQGASIAATVTALKKEYPTFRASRSKVAEIAAKHMKSDTEIAPNRLARAEKVPIVVDQSAPRPSRRQLLERQLQQVSAAKESALTDNNTAALSRLCEQERKIQDELDKVDAADVPQTEDPRVADDARVLVAELRRQVRQLEAERVQSGACDACGRPFE